MKNEKGLTLVEILATIVILTIISFFVFNLIVSSQKQQEIQQEDNQNLFDLSYTLKLITKDFRMSHSFDASSTTFKKNKVAIVKYTHTGDVITRHLYDSSGSTVTSSTEIAKNIKLFSLSKSSSDNSIIVDITNNSNQNIKNTLFYRE